jgi:hypothetical protein
MGYWVSVHHLIESHLVFTLALVTGSTAGGYRRKDGKYLGDHWVLKLP